MDLLLANGHPDDMVDIATAGVKYKEPLLLFHQEAGTLRNVSSEAGPVFRKSFPARGLAIGDFNNDGRIDVLVGINGQATMYWRRTLMGYGTCVFNLTVLQITAAMIPLISGFPALLAMIRI